MDEKMYERLDIAERKIDAIYESVEKVRKNLLYMIFLTSGLLFVPLVGIALLVAMLVNSAT